MEAWEIVVRTYSRVLTLASLGKIARSAEAALKEDLRGFEADRLASSFLFQPISSLDLVRLLENDSVWIKPLCDIFKVTTLLIDKYPDSVHKYHDEIVVACQVSSSARVQTAALQCRAALARTRAGKSVVAGANIAAVTDALRNEMAAREARAMLLGAICEICPEVVSDPEEVLASLLIVISAADSSEASVAAALLSSAPLVRQFNAQLPAALLGRLQRALAGHSCCRRCRLAVTHVVEQCSTALARVASQSSSLRTNLWRLKDTRSAATLYSAILNRGDAPRDVLREVYARLHSRRANERRAAKRVLACIMREGDGRQGSEGEEDGLHLRLLAGCSIQGDLVDAVWWNATSGSAAGERLLDACVVAHDRLPDSVRSELVQRGLLIADVEHVQRRVDLLVSESCDEEDALRRHLSLFCDLLCGNSRGYDDHRGGGDDDDRGSDDGRDNGVCLLFNALYDRLLATLELYIIGLDDCKKPCSLLKHALHALKILIEVMRAYGPASVVGQGQRLRYNLLTLLERNGPGTDICDVVRDLMQEMESYTKVMAGKINCTSREEIISAQIPKSCIFAPSRVRYCVRHKLAVAQAVLKEVRGQGGAEEEQTPDVDALPGLIDTYWPTYISTSSVSASVRVACTLACAGAVRTYGAVTQYIATLLLDTNTEYHNKGVLLAAMSDVISDDVTTVVAEDISRSLPARGSECAEPRAARATVTLVIAVGGSPRAVLLDTLVTFANGPADIGWWEGILTEASRRAVLGACACALPCTEACKVADLLRDVYERVRKVTRPEVVIRRLMEPMIRYASEANRARFLAACLPTIAVVIRAGGTQANGSLKLLLVLLDTVPSELVSEDSWSVVREVCALCIALLRRGSTDDPARLSLQQTAYVALCACFVNRSAGERTCLTAVDPRVLDAIEPRVTLALKDPPPEVSQPLISEAQPQRVFLNALVENSHRHDLFTEERFEMVQSQNDDTSNIQNPCTDALTSLLHHLSTLPANKNNAPQWPHEILKSFEKSRDIVQYTIAKSICDNYTNLENYALNFVPILLKIATKCPIELLISITKAVVYWGREKDLKNVTNLNDLCVRLVQESRKFVKMSVQLVDVLVRLLEVVPYLADEELLSPLLDDTNTRGLIYHALVKQNVRSLNLIPALVKRLPAFPHASYRPQIIELLAAALKTKTGDSVAESGDTIANADDAIVETDFALIEPDGTDAVMAETTEVIAKPDAITQALGTTTEFVNTMSMVETNLKKTLPTVNNKRMSGDALRTADDKTKSKTLQLANSVAMSEMNALVSIALVRLRMVSLRDWLLALAALPKVTGDHYRRAATLSLRVRGSARALCDAALDASRVT